MIPICMGIVVIFGIIFLGILSSVVADLFMLGWETRR